MLYNYSVNKFNKNSLEKKIWYRLFKVVYIVSLLLCILGGIGIFITTQPWGAVNGKVTCKNGKTYYLNENDIHFYPSGNLTSSGERKIKSLCYSDDKFKIRNKETGEELVVPYKDLDSYNISSMPKPDYQVEYIHGTLANWVTTFIYSLGGIIGCSFVVTIIKKTILYILIGGKWFKL